MKPILMAFMNSSDASGKLFELDMNGGCLAVLLASLGNLTAAIFLAGGLDSVDSDEIRTPGGYLGERRTTR